MLQCRCARSGGGGELSLELLVRLLQLQCSSCSKNVRLLQLLELRRQGRRLRPHQHQLACSRFVYGTLQRHCHGLLGGGDLSLWCVACCSLDHLWGRLLVRALRLE